MTQKILAKHAGLDHKDILKVAFVYMRMHYIGNL